MSVPARDDLDVLAERLGVTIDHEALRHALTHRSYAYENGGLPHNERLEFLGDAVLGLVVTDALYRDPSRRRGEPAGQVPGRGGQLPQPWPTSPASWASGEFLLLGRGEQTTGGRDKSSILADAMEAIIGAVYLDAGLEAADGPGAPAARRADGAGGRLGRGPGLEDLPAGARRAHRCRGARLRGAARPARTTPSTSHAVVRVGDEILGEGIGASKKLRRADGRRAGLRGAAPAQRRQPEPPAALDARAARGRGGPPGAGRARASAGRSAAARSRIHARCAVRFRRSPAAFAALLTGRTLIGTGRRGKFLWLVTDDPDLVLAAHLGMSGQFRVDVRRPAAPGPGHQRGGGRPRRVPRTGMRRGAPRPRGAPAVVPRPADVRLARRRARSSPTRAACSVPRPRRARSPPTRPTPRSTSGRWRGPCARHRVEVKRLLLAQTLVSGIGNIYADEALWAAGVHPRRRADRLSVATLRRRARAAAAVMAASLAEGGTSFDSLYVNVNGESGYFGRGLAVYGRAGLPCPRCGAADRARAVHEPVQPLLPGVSARRRACHTRGVEQSSPEPPVRLTATVQGYVQGVGFRWSTMALAQTMKLVGVAENLPNGDVLVIAEGPEASCQKVLDWLQRDGPAGRAPTRSRGVRGRPLGSSRRVASGPSPADDGRGTDPEPDISVRHIAALDPSLRGCHP